MLYAGIKDIVSTIFRYYSILSLRPAKPDRHSAWADLASSAASPMIPVQKKGWCSFLCSSSLQNAYVEWNEEQLSHPWMLCVAPGNRNTSPLSGNFLTLQENEVALAASIFNGSMSGLLPSISLLTCDEQQIHWETSFIDDKLSANPFY